MRVISGVARGRRLEPLRTSPVRPTPDRVREALFSILTARLPEPGLDGRCVLDLFAGSGALGIEALSRGAARAVFVETDREAVRILRANLERCRLADRGCLVRADVPGWLGRARDNPAENGGPFDLVLADPPYARDHHLPILETLGPPLLADGALVVLEHETGTDLPERAGALRRIDQRHYGRTALSFYRAAGVDPEGTTPSSASAR